MVSILAFDSNSVKSLIQPKFVDSFEEGFPIFYMNKEVIERTDHYGNQIKPYHKLTSAIDTAIENN